MMEYSLRKNSVYRISRLFSIKCTNNKSFHFLIVQLYAKKNNFLLLFQYIFIDYLSKRRGI